MDKLYFKHGMIKATTWVALFLWVMGLVISLAGCSEDEETFTYEPFEYEVVSLEAEFLGETKVDTDSMEDREASSILENVNVYLSEAKMLVDAEPEDTAMGGQWTLILTTEEGDEIWVTEAYEIFNEELESGATIRIDDDVQGYFTVQTFRELLDAFDAWLYL